MKNIKCKYNLPLIAMYIAASLFFLGSLKVPKMILSYLGIGGNITLIAVALFALLDAVLLLAVAQNIIKNKRWLYFLVLVALNLLYLCPYLLHGMWYQLIQYLVLIVPFSFCAYLVITEENGMSQFFRCLQNMSTGIFVFFLLYVVLLFVAQPGESGIVEIRELSYGDIAYAALPFLFGDLELLLTEHAKRKTFAGIRILVYTTAIIYSGTRSAMLCMAAAFVLQLVFHVRYILSVKKIYWAICPIALAACILLCSYITPAGSRLNVVKDDLLYELDGKDVSDIFEDIPSEDEHLTQSVPPEAQPPEAQPPEAQPPEIWPNDVTLLFNVETGRFESIDTAFQYYILKNNCTISETQAMLQADLAAGTGKYLYAQESFRPTAAQYSLPINFRVYLWSTAWGEFSSSKLLGNGCLNYQIKYNQTFPHNVVLELLADFGVIGFLLFFAVLGFCFVCLLIRALKTKNQGKTAMLAFICSYIPMFLLFHSLYFNGILFFTASYLILGEIHLLREKKSVVK